MDVNEVSRLLQSHVDPEYPNAGEYSWDGWSEHTWSRNRTADGFGDPIQVKGLGTVQMADTYTGGEGGGEACEMVFRITDVVGSVKHYRVTGYYMSYDGTTWDGDLAEVTPKQKTITVYE